MLEWLLIAAAYLYLAGGVTWFARRSHVVVIGATLVIASFSTSAASFNATFGSRVTIEILLALVIVAVAQIAANRRRCHFCSLVVAAALLDVAFCAVIAINPTPFWRTIGFGIVTNAVFILQCALVAAPRISDALVVRRATRASRRSVDHSHACHDVER